MLTTGYGVVIYNKFIFGLCPFLAQSSYHPWNCLSEECYTGVICYVSKMTFGKSLGDLRMWAGCQGNPSCWGLGAF